MRMLMPAVIKGESDSEDLAERQLYSSATPSVGATLDANPNNLQTPTPSR